MIFTNKQNEDQIGYYKKLLGVLGSLSNLFSDSSSPYLNYRISENLFCRSFDAKNLSRSDVSADASKEGVGIGLKTFVEGNSRKFQKIAEFNKDSDSYKNKSAKEIVQIISSLRNTRIDTTKRIHKLDGLIYHCVVRRPGKMRVFETNMDMIQVQEIHNIVEKQNKKNKSKNIITFADGLNEYSFNKTKSTLSKRFITPSDFIEIEVKIISDPFDTLENLLGTGIRTDDLVFDSVKKDEEHILLPLYSDRTKKVEEKSGLNQWNAGGRKRHPDEIYIPIPAWIHKDFDGFFPGRDVPFNLELPDGSIMNAKVCQEGGKAFMSNPNKALGKWLLRDVLNLKERELLTKQKLQEIGLDSIAIYKKSKNRYSINFIKTDSFEEFKSQLQTTREKSHFT